MALNVIMVMPFQEMGMDSADNAPGTSICHRPQTFIPWLRKDHGHGARMSTMQSNGEKARACPVFLAPAQLSVQSCCSIVLFCLIPSAHRNRCLQTSFGAQRPPCAYLSSAARIGSGSEQLSWPNSGHSIHEGDTALLPIGSPTWPSL